MGIKAGGFHEKFGQNDIKALWLSETGHFFDKMFACELCVFKIMDIFFDKYGIGAVIFS